MGSTTNPNGRLRVSSSISSIGTNRYRMTINLSVKSSLTWNAYGINCYAHIGSSKIHLGVFTIPQNSGVCKPNSYTYDFSVTSDTQVYASCLCTHCDGSDGWSAQSYADTATYVNPNSAPPKPTIKCLNYAASGKYLLETTLDAELSQVSDPDGNTVRYIIYVQYKTDSGVWQSAGDVNNCILYSTTDRKVTIDITKYARGTQFRIWGKAEDTFGATNGDTEYIENIYRNQAPTKPNITCNNEDIFNNNIIVENNIRVSLSNASDPEGLSVSYKIYGQYLKPGTSSWVAMGSNNLVSSNQSANIDISNYERGTRFKFWGAAFDNFGASSQLSSEINNIYRNRKPNTISTISPISKTIQGNTLSINWADPGDPDGQTVVYNVYVSKNDAPYELLNEVVTLKYDYNIANDPPYTKYRFKVVPYDKMVNGDETLSPEYRKDFPPSIILPINNSKVYQSNPRIVSSKLNNSNIYLCVNSGGQTYDSKSNPNLFAQNIKELTDRIYMCFTAKGISTSGVNVTIYCSDGTFSSSSVTIRLTKKELSISGTKDSIVRYDRNYLLTAISDLNSAYAISGSSLSNTTRDQIIQTSNLSDLRNSIANIRNKINEYDSNKISTVWNKNAIIKIKDIQQIIDAIKNI